MNMLRQFLRRKFVRDTLVLQAGKVVNLGLALGAWILTVRLMGIENYGVWGLMLSFYAIWQVLDLTGVGLTTANGLGVAVGRGDAAQILDLLAFYVKLALAWALLTVVVLVLFGPAVAARLYDGDPRVGRLAALFSLTGIADALYTLVILSLQSRRLMPQLALLQNANQVVLVVCVVAAMLFQPLPETLVVGRVIYSFSTMLLAFAVYERLRGRGTVAFPPLAQVFRAAPGVPLAGRLRAGVMMALDKNLGNLFTQAPVTLVGVLRGPVEAGYLRAALDGLGRSAVFTGPVLDNMQAVVPQHIGREDYAGLQRNFGRVLRGMVIIGVGIYGMVALASPLILPLLLGREAAPAAPVLIILTISGVVTTVGGIFGPLYRALGQVRQAFAAKVAAVVLMLAPALWLVGEAGAAGGAWVVNGLYALSVGLTIAATLPALRRRALSSTHHLEKQT